MIKAYVSSTEVTVKVWNGRYPPYKLRNLLWLPVHWQTQKWNRSNDHTGTIAFKEPPANGAVVNVVYGVNYD